MSTWPVISACVFLGIALPLIFWDLRDYQLPARWTQLLLWAGLLVNLHRGFTPLSSAVLGAVSGYCSFWMIRWAFHRVTHREGLGLGDCKLLGSLGAWIGWQKMPELVLIASLCGLLVSIVLLCTQKRSWRCPIPFGPMLLLASGCILFF